MNKFDLYLDLQCDFNKVKTVVHDFALTSSRSVKFYLK